MTGYVYEKSLRNMKYRIVTAPLQNKTVKEISDGLGMNIQNFRAMLIENFDMSYLENMPTRYDVWKGDEMPEFPDRLLFTGFLTKYMPIIKEEEMELLITDISGKISGGMSEEEAVIYGREKIRGLVLK
jgi:energy-converting hydrogenase A subunit M